jgi:hypothetical protein
MVYKSLQVPHIKALAFKTRTKKMAMPPAKSTTAPEIPAEV